MKKMNADIYLNFENKSYSDVGPLTEYVLKQLEQLDIGELVSISVNGGKPDE